MDDLTALLNGLPEFASGFMAVIARVGTTLLTGPGFGENEIPAPIRVALAVGLSVLVYPLLQGTLPPPPPTVIALIGLLALEVVVGAWLGFLARIAVMALAIAGDIISFMIGLSSVLQIDPSLGTQVPALQRMMALTAVALLFASGLYILPLQAVVGSYEVIPAGTAFDTAGAAQLVTRMLGGSFSLALRLAAPFVITCVVWQAALGFISRLVPNIQVHVISAPAQILGGLALLSIASAAILSNWTASMRQMFSALPGL